MLRLNFRSVRGDSPTFMLARCVRCCADGTLRGPDNFVIARWLPGGWQVGGRLHRDLECEGPVSLRLTTSPRDTPRMLGPFKQLRTVAGMLYGDDACLEISVPGQGAPGDTIHQLTLLGETKFNGTN